MDANLRDLRRKQLDAQLAPIAKLAKVPTPRGGWIRAIRESLGISLEQLANRLRLSSSSTAFQLERGEVDETISIKRMRSAADALGCDLVVALVPRKPLERYVRDQARRKAADQLGRVSHTMAMESQGVRKAELAVLLESSADEIIRRGGRHLWD
jgi:predicted DNA-binding mobile mystery protein A